MLAIYGRLRKFLTRFADDTVVSPLSDEGIIEILESKELGNITAFILLGTEYAAIGGTALKLRALLDEVNVPVIIIVETETLLGNKRPTNPNAVIVVEKSKKPEVLAGILKRCLSIDISLPMPEGSATVPELSEFALNSESNKLPELEESYVRTEQVTLPNLDKSQSHEVSNIIEVEQEIQVPVFEPEEVDFRGMSESGNQVDIQTEEPVESGDEVQQVFSWKIRELPQYPSLDFEKPEDVLGHLRKKWNLDGVLW